MAQPIELTGIKTDHRRARPLQRSTNHHAIGVGDGLQQHLAHTTITAHHGHTDRIVLWKETVLPARAGFEKP